MSNIIKLSPLGSRFGPGARQMLLREMAREHEGVLRLGGWISHGMVIDGQGFIKDVIPFSHNLIVTQGRDHIGNVQFVGTPAATSPWYIGLTDGTPTIVAADSFNPASHAGWTEVTDYTEGVRQTWVEVLASPGSWGNAASVASYSINGTTTVGGCFLATVSTYDNGATGLLYSAVDFSGGDRSLQNNDTLEITYTQTTVDDAV